MDEYVSKNELMQYLEPLTNTPGIVIKRYVEDMPSTDVQPVNRWISVKDRLPDDCVEVLVHDTDCGIIIGWYDKKDDVFVAEFINQLDAVTHWQPLPELPKDSDVDE